MKRFASASPCLLGIVIATILAASSATADIYTYTATLSGGSEVPPVSTPATGVATFTLDTDLGPTGAWTVQFSGLTGAQTAAGFYDGAAGTVGTLWFAIPLGSPQSGNVFMDLTHTAAFAIGGAGVYVNIHTVNFPGGEIRGHFQLAGVVASERSTWGRIKSLYR